MKFEINEQALVQLQQNVVTHYQAAINQAVADHPDAGVDELAQALANAVRSLGGKPNDTELHRLATEIVDGRSNGG